MEMHERLRKARADAGYSSAADAARRLGVPYGTYSGHENGQRGIKWDDLRTYAKAFKVTTGWLLYSDEETVTDSELIAPFALTSFSGLIREGGRVDEIDPDEGIPIFDENGQEVDTLFSFYKPYFASGHHSVLFLTTNELAPVAKYGDIVVINSEEIRGNFDEWLYRLVLCSTSDEKLWFRELQPSAHRGRYNLYSSSAPPVVDQKISYIQAFEAILKHDVTEMRDAGKRYLRRTAVRERSE